VFDNELKRLDNPAPAAVIIEGVVAFCCNVDEEALFGRILDFFGEVERFKSI
jgi:hypothetical protein